MTGYGRFAACDGSGHRRQTALDPRCDGPLSRIELAELSLQPCASDRRNLNRVDESIVLRDVQINSFNAAREHRS
jgi:hypothetical protein